MIRCKIDENNILKLYIVQSLRLNIYYLFDIILSGAAKRGLIYEYDAEYKSYGRVAGKV